MSQANIDLVKRSIDALNEHDLDRAVSELPDDFVLDWSNSIGPYKNVYEGTDRIREFWTLFVEAFDEFAWEPQEIIQIDESRVIFVNRTTVRGSGSGVETQATGVQLWVFEGGVPRSSSLFQTKDEAMAAAGLGGD